MAYAAIAETQNAMRTFVKTLAAISPGSGMHEDAKEKLKYLDNALTALEELHGPSG